MPGKLKNKSILLGVSGGVAAYKAVELVRRLKDEGASVTVIMTEAAATFYNTSFFRGRLSQQGIYLSL